MFPNPSGIVIHGGTFVSQTNRTSKGMDLLLEWVATGAFHNSDELYDAPKCHPHTRVAVLDGIMQWVKKSESARDDFMLWLFGPAGAGKSAIAKRIAEIAANMGMLIATFFFSRTSPDRSNKDRLISTLAYQLAQSIPNTRFYIEDAIEQDPTIFRKNVQTQIDTLLIKPLQAISPPTISPSKNLIIIDGLDECNDSKAQLAILEAISHTFIQHDLPIKFLVVSRPEISLVTLFTSQEPLKSNHRRLALDDTYKPDDDIRLFLSDKFKQIRLTHPLKSTIPISWPAQEMLKTLVEKSSGQFIYASTVIKFVESIYHRPSARLNTILGVSPPGRMNPFAELDALYHHILSSVDDIQTTLRVLSLYVMTPKFASSIFPHPSMSPEIFLSLEPGDIHLSLLNLSSIVTYDERFGMVKVLHASLVDFLSDIRRSTTFYIDMASTTVDFVHRILQYVKGPDGIQAGDLVLFRQLNNLDLSSCQILKGQLRRDILNFDLDAFLNASNKWRYKEYPYLTSGSTMGAFVIWSNLLDNAGLDNGDKKEALDRLNKSLESRVQTYQSDWRLQLLLTLAVANDINLWQHGVLYCRCVDIFLEMDDHDLHIIDQHALDLRHGYMVSGFILRPYVNGDAYASAALHCMHVLSRHPRKYSKENKCSEMGLIYAEWKTMCAMTLRLLRKLLQRANTLPELLKFICNHDIHPAVQRYFPTRTILEADVHILVFLSQANVCPNWRIISAIQRYVIINRQQSSKLEENSLSFDEDEKWIATRHLILQRLDQCCSKTHKNHIWYSPPMTRT